MTRLISWLLNIVYLALLAICAPFVAWAAIRTGKYRDGYAHKLLGLVPRREGDAACVWLHAVSVGEVNLIATILRQLRAAHPDWDFVVSTTSRTGYELATIKYSDLTVFYCPLDLSWAVRTAVRRIRPTMLVLAELELWPNLILAAKSAGARVAILNGRMSDHSFPGYLRFRPLVAQLLSQIDLIAAQNEESADRFRALGAPAERVQVTGSLKYDGAQTDRANPRTIALRQLAGFADDDVVLLAGSTQEPEERYSLETYRQLSVTHPRLRLVLVPRHPERFEAVAELLEQSGIDWRRRSQLASGPSREPTARRPILLVDTVGELGAWWGAATIAFVGGSFGPRGGQNMIEPAAYGAAVSFGPNTRNFRDVVAALLAAEGAVVVRSAAELEAFVRRCLEEPEWAASLGANAQALVRSQLGATERTLRLVESLLPQASARRSAA
ncbi:MAG: 3-deoxy-D-manno-octulosonic acid transferase [Pirellulales bacterium]